MKKSLFLVLFLISCIFTNARTVTLCFTDKPLLADVTIGFTSSAVLADICIWVGTGSFTDVDVCFVDRPLPSSIDIKIVNTPALADATICLTDKLILADKSLSIVSNIGIADICLGLWNSPNSFTKDIYIEGINPKRLSNEAKVSIVYALGLLKKED